MLAGANVCVHAAGWLESGLTNSYEKCMIDIEVLQMPAELCVAPPASAVSCAEALDGVIARRTEEGGAAPVS